MNNSDDFTQIDIESNKSDSTMDLNVGLNIPKENQVNSIFRILILCILFCGSIIYLIFTIIALIKTSYKEQLVTCDNSNIWICILVNLIVNGLNCIFVINYIFNKCIYIEKENLYIFLAILAWECYELFGVNCINNLKSSILYIILQVNVFIGFIIIGIILGIYYTKIYL
jgi:hypothetical protein